MILDDADLTTGASATDSTVTIIASSCDATSAVTIVARDCEGTYVHVHYVGTRSALFVDFPTPGKMRVKRTLQRAAEPLVLIRSLVVWHRVMHRRARSSVPARYGYYQGAF